MRDQKILIVDDDAWILSCFQRMLGRSFDLETAIGPVHGLHFITTRGPYAVVLSDLKMPGMDGLALLAKVKEMSPSTIRLLLTGYADPRETDRSLQNGLVFKLVEKPCPLDQLKKILEEALTKYEENPLRVQAG
jgi:DNA-binding NtrC family response regulator